MTFNLNLLGAWMDEQGLPTGAFSCVERLGGGTQNLLIRFQRGSETYVLRHPPEHKRANSDETMRREARVLNALANSDVPHPRLIAACGDETVLGAAFYLMEAVDGANPTVSLPDPYRELPHWQWELGLAAVDGAAAIGAIDYEAAGISDLGRPEGYLERQVERWRAQLESYTEIAGYPGPELGDVDKVGTWLETNRPTEWRPGLIHGDYHLANILCSRVRPVLAAIVDWELTTIGDPMLDLGWLLATWPEPASSEGGLLRNLPPAHVLIAQYGQRSKRDMAAVAWYEVMACYKLGLILEGTFARACGGQAPMDTGRRLRRRARRLIARALQRIASS